MIEKMLEKVKPFLPLKIATVKWDGTVFQIFGEGWNFTTLSSWRIIEENRMVAGCLDENALDVVMKLLNEDIIDIACQDSRLKLDPIFMLSNKQILEVFSTDTFEPWIFDLKQICFFSSSPNEPSSFMSRFVE